MANIVLPKANILTETNENTKFIVEQDGVLKRFAFNPSGDNNTGKNNISYIGGKAVFLGSTFTYNNNGNSYAKVIQERNVFDSVKIYARNGCTFGSYGNNNFSTLINNYATDISQADYIFLESSYEDMECYRNNDVEIATIKSSSQTIFERLRSLNPTAKIYYLGATALDIRSLLCHYVVCISNWEVLNQSILLCDPIWNSLYWTNDYIMNDLGCVTAADNLLLKMFQSTEVIFNPNYDIWLSGDLNNPEAGYSLPVDFRFIRDLLTNDFHVKIYAWEGVTGGKIFFTPGMINDYFVSFSSKGYYGDILTSIFLLADNTIWISKDAYWWDYLSDVGAQVVSSNFVNSYSWVEKKGCDLRFHISGQTARDLPLWKSYPIFTNCPGITFETHDEPNDLGSFCGDSNGTIYFYPYESVIAVYPDNRDPYLSGGAWIGGNLYILLNEENGM